MSSLITGFCPESGCIWSRLSSYGIGYKLENLVYLELRRAGYDIYVGAMRDKEVDFVVKKG